MSNLYEILRPVLEILKRSGSISYTTEVRDEKTYLKQNYCHLVISEIGHGLLLCFSVYWNYNMITSNKLFSTLEFMTLLSYNVLQLIYLTFNGIITKFNNSKLLHVINAMTEIEFKMLQYDPIIMNYGHFRMVIKCILGTWIFTITAFVYLFALEYIVQIKSFAVFLRYIGINYIFLTDQILFLKFAALVMTARQILLSLNSNIHSVAIGRNKNLRRRTQNHIKTIKDYIKMYQNLFQCISDINSFFSLTMLFQIGANFSFTILHVFSCSSMIILTASGENVDGNLQVLLVSTFYQVIVFLLYIIPSEVYLAEVILLDYFEI